jgi:hypothetical protein
MTIDFKLIDDVFTNSNYVKNSPAAVKQIFSCYLEEIKKDISTFEYAHNPEKNLDLSDLIEQRKDYKNKVVNVLFQISKNNNYVDY